MITKFNETLSMYNSLQDMIKNINLEYIPFFKKGYTIKIKKKNRGKFKQSAKRVGKSVQQHAKDILNNPKATKLQKKRAIFAKNAAKWN